MWLDVSKAGAYAHIEPAACGQSPTWLWSRVRFFPMLHRIIGWLTWSFRPSAIEVLSYAELRNIHERRFQGTDPERFVRLWCEIAGLCGVSPMEMHENDRPEELCPPHRVLGLVEPNAALEEISALIMAESRDRPLPASRPSTVGDVLDYLLGTSAGG